MIYYGSLLKRIRVDLYIWCEIPSLSKCVLCICSGHLADLRKDPWKLPAVVSSDEGAWGLKGRVRRKTSLKLYTFLAL